MNRYELGRDVRQLGWVDAGAGSPGIDAQAIALGLAIHIQSPAGPGPANGSGYTHSRR